MNEAKDLKTLRQGQTTDLASMSHKQQVKTLLDRAAPVLKKSLPKHLSADRLMQVAITAATTTPALAECYVPSLIGGVMQCGLMGLEPNTVLGHAYLVPFTNKAKNRKDVQVIIGYKGLIDLARRSGQIQSIAAHAVYDADHFEYQYGLIEKLEHIPADGERGEITHFYAISHMKDGGHAFEVMSRHVVEGIMKKTQSGGKYGPWKDHFEEMGRKTAIRRLAKYLPISIDLARAVTLDESADDGRDQQLDAVMEGQFDTVLPNTPEQELLEKPEVIVDSNGEAFDPNLHGQNDNGPIFNQDGSFKARRGTGSRAAAKQPAPANTPEANDAAAEAALNRQFNEEQAKEAEGDDLSGDIPDDDGPAPTGPTPTSVPGDVDAFGSME